LNAPLTIEQFLSVFVAYNAAIWPARIVAYVLGLLAVSALWLNGLRGNRLILSILALSVERDRLSLPFLC
jgi:integral membrane sensor domain MASE1